MGGLLPIIGQCVRGAAGVASLLLIEGSNVQSLAFNDDGEIIQVNIASGSSFTQILFEPENTQFDEKLKMERNNPVVTQTLSIYQNGRNNAMMLAMSRMRDCCELHGIVETQDGKYYYLGINVFPFYRYHWESAGLRVKSGFTERGVWNQGDVGMNQVLEIDVNHYAPEVLDISNISITTGEPTPTPDTAPPLHVRLSPPDDSLGVSLALTELSIQFNETVQRGTGTIELRRFSDDVLVDSFDVTDPSVVYFSSNTRVHIVLTSLLTANESYYVIAPAGTFQDSAGNNWAGITTKGSFNGPDWVWRMEQAGDTTAPVLVTLSPADEATGVVPPYTGGPTPTEFSLTFDESVQPGTGFISLYDYGTDTLIISLDVNGSAVTFDGSTKVTLDFTDVFPSGGQFYILVDATAIEDTSGNAWGGFSDKEDWDFTVDSFNLPTVDALFPPLLTTEVGKKTEIYMDISKVVSAGTGTIKLVEYVDGTGPIDEGGNDILHRVWQPTDVDVVITTQGAGVRISFTGMPFLGYFKSYYMVIPDGAFVDSQGQSIPTYHWATIGPPDAIWFWTTADQLQYTFSPSNGGNLACYGIPTFNVGFGVRGMIFRDGWFKVYDYDTDVLLASFPVQVDVGVGNFNQNSQTNLSSNGDEVHLNQIPWPSSNHVYVLWEEGLIYDVTHDEDLPGMTTKTDWHFFITADATIPTVSSTVPSTGGTFIPNDTKDYIQLEFTLTRNAQRNDYLLGTEEKYITIREKSTTTEVVKISSADVTAVFYDVQVSTFESETRWRVIIPGDALETDKLYQIKIDQGFFISKCGVLSAELAWGSWEIQGADYVP